MQEKENNNDFNPDIWWKNLEAELSINGTLTQLNKNAVKMPPNLNNQQKTNLKKFIKNCKKISKSSYSRISSLVRKLKNDDLSLYDSIVKNTYIVIKSAWFVEYINLETKEQTKDYWWNAPYGIKQNDIVDEIKLSNETDDETCFIINKFKTKQYKKDKGI